MFLTSPFIDQAIAQVMPKRATVTIACDKAIYRQLTASGRGKLGQYGQPAKVNDMQATARAYLRLVGCEYIALGALGLTGLHGRSESLYVMAALGAMFLLVSPLLLVMPNGIRATDYVKSVGSSNLTPSEVHSAVLTLTLLCILAVLGGVLAAWAGKGVGLCCWSYRASQPSRIAFLCIQSKRIH